jgi:hypothetical protein
MQDGFEGDTVVLRVDGSEAYRGEDLTTRSQISLAADTEIAVPEGTFSLEVDVPTRGVRETFELDAETHPNVSLSLREGRLVAHYPEFLGYV